MSQQHDQPDEASERRERPALPDSDPYADLDPQEKLVFYALAAIVGLTTLGVILLGAADGVGSIADLIARFF